MLLAASFAPPVLIEVVCPYFASAAKFAHNRAQKELDELGAPLLKKTNMQKLHIENLAQPMSED